MKKLNPILDWAIRIALLFAGILLFVALMNTIAKAQEPLGQHIRWGTHPALGVIFEYRIEGRDVYYAHPVHIEAAPYPECRGQVMNPLGHPDCKPFQMRMGEIFLVHVEDGMPILYVLALLPTHRKVNGGDYESLVLTTWGRK